MELCSNVRKESIFYILVQILVWILVSLPTIFYIRSPSHTSHPYYTINSSDTDVISLPNSCILYHGKTCEKSFHALDQTMNDTKSVMDKDLDRLYNILVNNFTSTQKCPQDLKDVFCIHNYKLCLEDDDRFMHYIETKNTMCSYRNETACLESYKVSMELLETGEYGSVAIPPCWIESAVKYIEDKNVTEIEMKVLNDTTQEVATNMTLVSNQTMSNNMTITTTNTSDNGTTKSTAPDNAGNSYNTQDYAENNNLEDFFSIHVIGKRPPKLLTPEDCNEPLTMSVDRLSCQVPCDWSVTPDIQHSVHWYLMVFSFWAALIATIITLITWAGIKPFRKFPHIVRFYMMLSSVFLACSSMFPLRVGLVNTFCVDQVFWEPEGHTSNMITIQGALVHYFTLVLCFWSLCYVFNNYSVLVLRRYEVFEYSRRIHLLQSLICWLLPACFVLICCVVDYPGYRFMFIDRLESIPKSINLTYFTTTLPVQISLGISLSILVSILRDLRKSRKNTLSGNVIRSDEQLDSMKRVERQFKSMALIFVVVISIVLSAKTALDYNMSDFVHQAESYFSCISKNDAVCPKPWYPTFLPAISIIGSGFYCLVNFFLLLFNQDSRKVWSRWGRKICCRQEQGNRPRAGSTLTTLNTNVVTNVVDNKTGLADVQTVLLAMKPLDGSNDSSSKLQKDPSEEKLCGADEITAV